MIDEYDGIISIQCDQCPESFDPTDVGEGPDGIDGEEFKEVWRAAKAAGWRARKIGNAWEHRCPACSF